MNHYLLAALGATLASASPAADLGDYSLIHPTQEPHNYAQPGLPARTAAPEIDLNQSYSNEQRRETRMARRQKAHERNDQARRELYRAAVTLANQYHEWRNPECPLNKARVKEAEVLLEANRIDQQSIRDACTQATTRESRNLCGRLLSGKQAELQRIEQAMANYRREVAKQCPGDGVSNPSRNP